MFKYNTQPYRILFLYSVYSSVFGYSEGQWYEYVCGVNVCIMTHLLYGVRRYNQLLKQKAQLEELEKVLKAEQEKMLSENQRHQATAAEYHKLKEENDKWVNSISTMS